MNPEVRVEPTMTDLMNMLIESKIASKAMEERLARLELVQSKNVVNLEDEPDAKKDYGEEMDEEDFADYLAKKEERESKKMKSVKEEKKVVGTATSGVGIEYVVEKIDKIQAIMKKSQGIENYLVGIDDLCPYPDVHLPEGFKMPKLDPFDGTGNPHYHLRNYVGIMRPLGLSREVITLLFPRSLKGAALKWYLSQDTALKGDWDAMAYNFLCQYNFNTESEITIQDLELTKQLPNESFVDFVARWRGKVALMASRPAEKEQLRLIVKNLQPCYYNTMFNNMAKTFDDLNDLGKKVQEAIQTGKIGKTDGKPKDGSSSNSYGNNGRPNQRKSTDEVNTLGRTGSNRTFTPLGMPYSKALAKLVKANALALLQPSPRPNPLPRWWKENEYCEFHQGNGHSTERCLRLKHEIEDLMDQGEIPRPSPKPNVNQNPLPNYHAVPPPRVNAD